MSDDLLPLQPEPEPAGFDVVLRGYDRRQVEEYIERVEIALIDADRQHTADSQAVLDLQHQLAALDARLAEAERRAKGQPDPASLVGERLLTMLQLAEQEAEEIIEKAREVALRSTAEHTADLERREQAAVAATAEAEQLRLQAQQDADAVRTRAQQDAAELRARAEEDAQAVAADAQRQGDEIVGKAQEQARSVHAQADEQARSRVEAAESEATQLREQARHDAQLLIDEARQEVAELQHQRDTIAGHLQSLRETLAAATAPPAQPTD